MSYVPNDYLGKAQLEANTSDMMAYHAQKTSGGDGGGSGGGGGGSDMSCVGCLTWFILFICFLLWICKS
jgi:hypothetical protein